MWGRGRSEETPMGVAHEWLNVMTSLCHNLYRPMKIALPSPWNTKYFCLLRAIEFA